MACALGSGSMDRNDPNYMAMLEEHFIKSTAQTQDDKDDLYLNIVHRLDKLQAKTNTDQGGQYGRSNGFRFQVSHRYSAEPFIGNVILFNP